MLGLINTFTIGGFLESREEQIEDEEQDIFESVVQMYSVVQAEESENKGEEEVVKVSKNEDIGALETLRLYEIQQENGSHSNLQALD
ncbi:hypothetical protein GcM3_180026, partial [Golovinomyces cichoracearum]